MKILIAGDYCPRARTASLIEENRFEEILGEVKPIIESADYSLVNFECTVVDNLHAKPILKCGPNLQCTSRAVDALRYVGFKGVTLANNHVLDFDVEGLSDTIAACKANNLDMVGVGVNLKDAATVLYKIIENKTVAFINCCEHEFSIATDVKPGTNPLNAIQQFYSIKEARKLADFVIIIVHGGHEFFQLPSPRMKELYRFFVDCGADVVVNHHQHCFSGYEVYNGKPIFYGLGNFCFDNESFHSGVWTEGYMLELSINSAIRFNLIPYIQCADKAQVGLMCDIAKQRFLNTINSLCETIADDEVLKKKHSDWMIKTSGSYKLVFTPYSNRYLRAAASRSLIPLFLSKKRILNLINYVQCESHRDRILSFLNNKI